MDSMVDVLSEQPWGQTYTELHSGYSFGWRRDIVQHHYNFSAQFKLTKDRKWNYWFRGDIVKFNTGFYDWQFNQKYQWKKWFLSKEDYLKALEKSCFAPISGNVPKYARLEFGMILSRYKWIKHKGHGIFCDYGSIIIMLTGSKPGRVRRYYVKTPYYLISRYPYDHIMSYYAQRGVTLPEVGRIQEAMNYSKSKEQFILNIVASFSDENYPMNLEKKNDTRTNFRIIREGTEI